MQDMLRYTFRRLLMRPLRTFLTVLQVALGIWAITLIVSANINMRSEIQRATDRYGQNLIALTVGTESVTEDGTIRRRTNNHFGVEHIALAKESPNVLGAYLVEDLSRSYAVAGQHTSYMLQGFLATTADFPAAAGIELIAGDLFTAVDVEQGNRVIVVSETVADELFHGSAIGQNIQIADTRLERAAGMSGNATWARLGSALGGSLQQMLEFEVIGVFRNMDELQTVFVELGHAIIPLGAQSAAGLSGQDRAGQSPRVGQMDQMVQGIAPQLNLPQGLLESVQGGINRMGAAMFTRFRTLVVEAAPGRVHAAAEDMRVALQGGIGENEEVFVEYLKDRDQALFATVQRVITFFAAFGFIAIVISSVGILSLMLVSVVEKTRDIGLHRALGATKNWIALQFLGESVMVSALGSVLGIALAAVSGRYVLEGLLLKAFWADLVPFSATLSPWAVLLSLLIAILTGLLFGLYPAREAGNLPPVEAIRQA